MLARTDLGRPTRVLLAGHIDTVPIAGNVPSRLDGDTLHGCGTTDMKSGDAMLLHLAATLTDPAKDLTFVFYECEEIDYDRNGLTRIEKELPGLADRRPGAARRADQRAGRGRLSGHRVRGGHDSRDTRSTRPDRGWATTRFTPRRRCSTGSPRTSRGSIDVDGCTYREGLNAVGISGGVAGNIIPDECTVRVNYRFAPDRPRRTQVDRGHRGVFDGFEVAVLDSRRAPCRVCPRPPPRSSSPPPAGWPKAKFGWTDVARFAALGIPAVNYGPGDPRPRAHPGGMRVR